MEVEVGKLNDATSLARATIRSLIELGVANFVLSPGSRNAPLSIALHEASERGLIELHVKIDERGAAYFALGIAKATNNYVAIICTSGTAAANYHPAALEALHANNKLLIITADRPERLRNTGANQTTNQVDIYPGIKTHDITVATQIKLKSGPVHLNLQFDEPLLNPDKSDWLAGLHVSAVKSANISDKKRIRLSGNGLVVIGHDQAGLETSAVLEFTSSLGLPVVAEDPLSYPDAIAHSSISLADENIREFLKPDFVIVIGRTTLSRSINTFIAAAAKTYVIDERVQNIDSARTATETFFEIPEVELESLNPSWISDWNSVCTIAEAEIAKNNSWSESVAVSSIVHQIPTGSALFIGSSRPIRDVEAFAIPRSGLTVFANRGLAGIDGNISTTFGITQQFMNTYAILGDLTFMHDLTALLSPPDANLTIFVIDNNGGGIFSTLPQAGVAGFETIFGTPQNKDLEKLISGFGIQNERVKTVSDIERIIAHGQNGLKVVIVEVPEREVMATALREIYTRVSKAVRIGVNLA